MPKGKTRVATFWARPTPLMRYRVRSFRVGRDPVTVDFPGRVDLDVPSHGPKAIDLAIEARIALEKGDPIPNGVDVVASAERQNGIR